MAEMPLPIKLDKPRGTGLTIADRAAIAGQAGIERPSVLAIPPEPAAGPGFLRAVGIAGRNETFLGQGLTNTITSVYDAITQDQTIDESFNPYDLVTPDLVQRYPFLLDDIESNRIGDFANRQQFDLYLMRRDERDHELRELDRMGLAGRLGASLVGQIPDLAFGGAALKMGTSAMAARSVVAADLAVDAARVFRTAGAAGVGIRASAAAGANVLQELGIAWLDPDRDMQDANLAGAAFMGLALGGAVEGIAAGARRAGATHNASWIESRVKEIRRNFQPDGIKTVDDVVRINGEELKRLVAEEVPQGEVAKPIARDELAPGMTVRLYRGEGGGVMGSSVEGGDWWTTDINTARKFGKVRAVDIRAESLARISAQGHNAATTFVIQGGLKRLKESGAVEINLAGPTGPRVINVFDTPEQMELVAKLQKAYGDTGHELIVNMHPFDETAKMFSTLESIEAEVAKGAKALRKAVEEGRVKANVVQALANVLDVVTPAGQLRRTVSDVVRRAHRTIFDEVTPLPEVLEDPLNATTPIAAENLKTVWRSELGDTVKQIQDAHDSIAKGGKKATYVTADGTKLTLGSRWRQSDFGRAVVDFLHRLEEIEAGIRPAADLKNAPPAVAKAAEAVRRHFVGRAGRLEAVNMLDVDLLDRITELKQRAKAISDEIAAGKTPVGADDPAVRLQATSDDLAKAQKQLAERRKTRREKTYLSRKWLSHVIEQNRDDFTARLKTQFFDNMKRGEGRLLSPMEWPLVPEVMQTMLQGENAEAFRRALNQARAVRKGQATLFDPEPRNLGEPGVAAKQLGPEKGVTQATRNRMEGGGQASGSQPVSRELAADLKKAGISPAAIKQMTEAEARLVLGLDDVVLTVGDLPGILQATYRFELDAYAGRLADATFRNMTDLTNRHGVQQAFSGGSPLQQRILEIDPTRFSQYLDDDLGSILKTYDHTLAGKAAVRDAVLRDAAWWGPKVKSLLNEELTGDLEQVVRAIKADFQAKIDALQKAGKATSEIRDIDILGQRLAAARDSAVDIFETRGNELMGQMFVPGNPAMTVGFGRFLGRNLLKVISMSKMGKVALSSISDLGGMTMYAQSTPHYLRNVASTLRNFANFAREIPREGLEGLLVATDEDGIARTLSLAELDDMPITPNWGVGTMGKVWRGADAVTDKVSRGFFKATGMNRWNTATKRTAARMIMWAMYDGTGRMAKAAELMKGGMGKAEALAKAGISEYDAIRLNRMGIDAQKAAKIHEQFRRHGVDVDNQPLAASAKQDRIVHPNLKAWDDAGLRDLFAAAVNAEVDNVIVTPNMLSRPLFESKWGWIGRAINQFQAFGFAAGAQQFAALTQRPGGQQLAFVGMMLTLGAISDAMHNALAGRRDFEETAELWATRPAGMIYAAVNRGGITGWLNRPLGVMDKTQFGVGAMLGNSVSSMQAARALTLQGAVLGPWADWTDSIFRGALHPMLIEGSEFDNDRMHTLRKALPFQNYILLDAIYQASKSAGMDNPFGPGRGLDLYPLPTRPGQDLQRLTPREPEP